MSNRKTIKLKQMSIAMYVDLLNGIFNLTDKEKVVFTAFLKFQQTNPKINVFTAEFKKAVAEKMNLTNFNTINVHLKNIKQKNALVYKQGYDFHPLFKNLEETNEVMFVWA